MSDPVRVNGVVVGRVSVSPLKVERGRASVSVAFKPDPIGIMHAGAKELDRER